MFNNKFDNYQKHDCIDWTYNRLYGCEMYYRLANDMELIRKERKSYI